MATAQYKLISSIDSPDQLKRLNAKQLREYCGELREFIIEQLAQNPGHLASSLGVVELTAAIHYVYNTPYDKLVWDVGHQAYAHKIITGRRDQFHTNRHLGGISGFPRMDESVYDSFGGGHASVSISAALGMAEAAKLAAEDRKVVAVIGDGALTGGLAFEALNNAGVSNCDILVILNDNHMAIAPNVGAMTDYLLKISTSHRYNRVKTKIWNSMSGVPALRKWLQNAGNAIKQGLLQQSNLFESLNFRYFGPVDGHDVVALEKVLRNLKDIPGPKLLHVVTVKGKGYSPAEHNQSLWHAPGHFNPDTGELLDGCADGLMRYQDVFGRTLLDLAHINDKIVGVTPAMPVGCSMDIMMKKMPARCFDVGIAEGHAVTFSAGLAAGGMRPFCNIYSSFVQRAYDNVIHDVAIQKLPVVMCLDRAGLVGEDGSTHQGLYDIPSLRAIPNLTIASPMNESELRNLMYTAQASETPWVIRYPRGKGSGVACQNEFTLLPVGRANIVREGSDVALLTFGPIGNLAAVAADRVRKHGVSVLHVDLRYVKPLDAEILKRVGSSFRKVVCVEEGAIAGGVGSAVQEFMATNGLQCNVLRMGIKDEFIEHGTIAQQRVICGLDEESIYQALLDFPMLTGSYLYQQKKLSKN